MEKKITQDILSKERLGNIKADKQSIGELFRPLHILMGNLYCYKNSGTNHTVSGKDLNKGRKESEEKNKLSRKAECRIYVKSQINFISYFLLEYVHCKTMINFVK